MIEKPGALAPEAAVLDPTLFLISKENIAYLKGQRPAPFLDPMRTAAKFRVFLFTILVGMFLVMLLFNGIATLVMNAQPTIWTMGITVILLMIFGCTLAYTFYFLLKQQSPPQLGVVLVGEIVQADRVWMPGNQCLIEVRYRFTAPGGVLETAQARGYAENASDTMAPLPGTPVRIYFTEDGKHYLL